jgi:regulatory protein
MQRRINDPPYDAISQLLTFVCRRLQTVKRRADHRSAISAMPRPQLSLKARALRLLSQREHSRLELSRKLARYVEEGDDLESLLNFLEQNKWLSEERFSENLVHRRVARYGNSRIVAELQSHGIAGERLAEVKAGLKEDEVERCCEVWRRKFGEVAQDPEGRNKQMRFLLARGFSQKAIRTAMKGTMPDEEY